MSGKKVWWPELLGAPATPAAMRISQDRPDVAVEVLPPASPFEPGLNPERVRLFINDSGIVQYVPIVG
ncbi:hypothetical protein C2845_PM13G04740 [Panicum miliaceum]|uniref:Subtilisin inhibitor 1 n=1 Tax=Panicum miliaceum TaxID=4540 RepID=A0A3L6RGG3_PANMI|nr:hypothetical protein C2845_PM13G04740 [Panicum miliaceum]